MTSRDRTFRRIVAIALAVGWGAFAAPPCLAELDPQARNELNYARGQMNYYKDQADGFDAIYARYGDYTATDLVLLRKDYLAVAGEWEKSAAAFDQGQAEEGRRLLRLAEKVRTPIDWPERIRCRERQAQVAPGDFAVLAESLPYSAADSRPALEAWVEARKRCAEAWGRCAEAMVPAADPAPLVALQDQAYAADIEEETAGWWFRWENTLERNVLADKAVTGAELTKAIEALRDVERQRIAARREDIEHLRRAREMERRRKQLDAEVLKAYQSARLAREEAVRKEQEAAAKGRR